MRRKSKTKVSKLLDNDARMFFFKGLYNLAIYVV